MTSKIVNVGKAAGAAAAAAPFARKLMTEADEDVRSSVKRFVESADHLYNQLSIDDRLRRFATDDNMRRDVERLVGSVQGRARSVGRGARGRLDRKALVIGAGLGVMVTCLVAALLYPRTRRRIERVADETRERASATAQDAREKVSGTVDDAREKVSDAASKLRGVVGKA
jgi:gas vesicle protein